MRRRLSMLCVLFGFSVAPAGADVLFARDSGVPPSVQQFTWRVIETHCNYHAHERTQRSFWAYHTRVRRIAGETVYSIDIASDVPWRKREPTSHLQMTIVDDDGLRLTALESSFITCTP